jgi:transcriptional regulator with XRE-family HTH domain
MPNGYYRSDMANTPFGTNLGQALRARREELGLKQWKVAQLSGTTAEVLLGYEHGHHIPKADRLAALCRALELQPNELLSFAGPWNQETGEAA